MTAAGPLVRGRARFRVNGVGLAHPAAQAVSDASLHHLRRLLGRIAAQGFPFDDPGRAYLDARPPFTPIRPGPNP